MRALVILAAVTVVTAAHADVKLRELPLAPRPSLLLHAEPSLRAPAEASLFVKAPARRRPASYFDERQRRVERATLLFHHGYTLAEMRDRDRLLLYGATPGTENAATLGGAIFGTAIVLTAHAPARLRPLFDERWHVGPALFYGGGLGAGAGGRF